MKKFKITFRVYDPNPQVRQKTIEANSKEDALRKIDMHESCIIAIEYLT